MPISINQHEKVENGLFDTKYLMMLSIPKWAKSPCVQYFVNSPLAGLFLFNN